jgi:hypothetical protein
MSARLEQEGFSAKHKLSARLSNATYSNASGLRVKEWLNRVEAQSIVFKEAAVEFLTVHCQTPNLVEIMPRGLAARVSTMPSRYPFELCR